MCVNYFRLRRERRELQSFITRRIDSVRCPSHDMEERDNEVYPGALVSLRKSGLVWLKGPRPLRLEVGVSEIEVLWDSPLDKRRLPSVLKSWARGAEINLPKREKLIEPSRRVCPSICLVVNVGSRLIVVDRINKISLLLFTSIFELRNMTASYRSHHHLIHCLYTRPRHYQTSTHGTVPSYRIYWISAGSRFPLGNRN